jgi:hypothetical protein
MCVFSLSTNHKRVDFRQCRGNECWLDVFLLPMNDHGKMLDHQGFFQRSLERIMNE